MLRQLTQVLLLLAAACGAIAEASDLTDQRPAVVKMSMMHPASSIRRPIPQLLGLSWNDCGGPATWVKVKSVSVQPDPVRIDGKITVSVSFTVSHSFGDGQPLAASVVMKKKVFGTWFKLPCTDNMGSCNYGDLCTMKPPPKACPSVFVMAGVPCKCPVPAGNYTLPGYSFTVDTSKIPKFLEKGDYQIGVVANSGANQVLCMAFQLSLA